MSTESAVGRRLTITAGDYTAQVTEAGATLRALRCLSEDLLDGGGDGDLVDGCHGQVLAPWPNRLRDGRWEWQGDQMRLPVDEPDKGNSASHGLVRWSAWAVVRDAPDRVELLHRLMPRPGYPFRLDLTAGYALDAVEGLTATVVAVNAGPTAAPVALGAHPYLRPPGGGPIDGATLRLPAATRTLVDAWGMPVGREPVSGTRYDFRESRRLGSLALNDAFTDLEPAADGRVWVELGDDRGGAVVFWSEAPCRWLQVFSGDTLEPARRRYGLAIEPMTAPAGALASKVGLTVLAPGESLTLRWGVRRTGQ